MSIELEYVATGTTTVVPHAGRYEQPRIDSLAAAVRGILARDFPPRVGDHCATCPFWMVCPA